MLVVDDNAVDRETVRRALSSDYEVLEVSTAAECLAVYRSSRPDCVLLDYSLPDMDGLELLLQLEPSRVPVILLTGLGDEVLAVAAMKRGAADYLVKGSVHGLAMRKAVAHAIERATLRTHVDAQAGELRIREELLFAFLENVPLGTYVLRPDGTPYYANSEAERLLGVGISPGTAPSDFSRRYNTFVEGTDERYPAERMPIVRALSGEISTINDCEVRAPLGTFTISASAAPIRDSVFGLGHVTRSGPGVGLRICGGLAEIVRGRDRFRGVFRTAQQGQSEHNDRRNSETHRQVASSQSAP